MERHLDCVCGKYCTSLNRVLRGFCDLSHEALERPEFACYDFGVMRDPMPSILSIALFAIATASAPGAVIISNTPGTATSANGAIVGSLTRSLAQGFTMGSSDYQLDSVTMGLQVDAGGRNFDLQLFSGSPDPGGSALVSFTVPVLNTTGKGLYTFTPDVAFTLQANTTYWLVAYALQTGSPNQIRWLVSNPGVAPTGIATYAGGRFDSPAVIPPTGEFPVFSIFAVEGSAAATAVPEPSTALTVMAALAGIWGMARVRRARG